MQAQVSALEQSLLSKTKQRRPLAVYAAASQTVDPAARVRHADAEAQTVSPEPDSVVAAPSPRALTMVQAAAVTILSECAEMPAHTSSATQHSKECKGYASTAERFSAHKPVHHFVPVPAFTACAGWQGIWRAAHRRRMRSP